jgi:hypothetical protein
VIYQYHHGNIQINGLIAAELHFLLPLFRFSAGMRYRRASGSKDIDNIYSFGAAVPPDYHANRDSDFNPGFSSSI